MNKEEVLQEIRENISLLRKYAYEFGLSNDLETHGLMITAQRDTFDAIDKLANACEKIGMEKAANICEARYMGDNNREDMEARRCADAIRKST